MTAKETKDIVRDSSLWKKRSIQEKVEAFAYAMEVAGCKSDPIDDDVIDLIGEVYAG